MGASTSKTVESPSKFQNAIPPFTCTHTFSPPFDISQIEKSISKNQQNMDVAKCLMKALIEHAQNVIEQQPIFVDQATKSVEQQAQQAQQAFIDQQNVIINNAQKIIEQQTAIIEHAREMAQQQVTVNTSQQIIQAKNHIERTSQKTIELQTIIGNSALEALEIFIQIEEMKNNGITLQSTPDQVGQMFLKMIKPMQALETALTEYNDISGSKQSNPLAGGKRLRTPKNANNKPKPKPKPRVSKRVI